jgi:two-component system sensor kinase FixL
MPFHTTQEEGMGMRLSISRSLLDAHNGKLYFNSQLETGTTFYITLPI